MSTAATLPGLPWNSTARVVDDTYSGLIWTPADSWFHVISSNRQYNSTRTGTNSTNAQAKFTFSGTGVEVYGSVGSWDTYGVPQSTYSIDSGAQVVYTAPIVDPGYVLYPVLYYQSSHLSDGEHTLTITNINGTAPSLLWIDYFLYTPGAAAASSSSGTGTSLTSTPALPPSSTVTVPVANPSATNAPSKSKTPVGAIVGGVIGGMAVLAFLAILFLLCRRRRRRAKAAFIPAPGKQGILTSELEQRAPLNAFPNHLSPTSGTTEYSPYTSYATPAAQAPRSSAGLSGAPTTMTWNGASSTTGLSESRRLPAVPPTRQAKTGVLPPRAPEQAIQHQDSGVRLHEIPPVYTQD